ncbi:chemoreceptor glutamine deamidase CheD [Marinomonas spartinae]|uniref:chemoreceptor glutamine deamidase CheD n=1 Tax=Marinomonas spartinae TaxID=1792290 RepID=UPI0018F21884|nr:chemoreceptor glutamine deamidase CheD [Marinomonas spartinae]MBJ7554400.1 chemoreceptor glutamine deamidase CheD [Marinomonas spartinae]
MYSYSKSLEHLATHKYYDNKFKAAGVKVLPGEYYASKDDIMITTLLGSCVAACLFDEEAKVGGLNHFLLPGEDGDNSMLSSSGRYGVYAMELLVNHLMKLGARRERIKAKVFGGANVIKSLSSASSVGERNVAFIMMYLKQENIPVCSSSVLDITPRKVNFFPQSGKAFVKQLADIYQSDVVAQEKRYQGKAKEEVENSSGGDIDFF